MQVRPGLEYFLMLFTQTNKCFRSYGSKSHLKINMFQSINNALEIVLEKDKTAGKLIYTEH